jgi:hypothetical protein
MVSFPELHFRCYMFLLNNMPFSYMRDIMDNFQAGHTALTTRPARAHQLPIQPALWMQAKFEDFLRK